MNNILSQKQQLRKLIAEKRKQQSQLILDKASNTILEHLERTEVFSKANTIFIYHSIQGEVVTKHFIQKWNEQKDFYLPIINGNNMFFRKYISEDNLVLSKFGIFEPIGENVDPEQLKIDLVIVPGVAFDVNCNRMGYGKGFYDRFLKKIKTTKFGLCFNFQLFNTIPTSEQDVPMDFVINEKGIINKINRE